MDLVTFMAVVYDRTKFQFGENLGPYTENVQSGPKSVNMAFCLLYYFCIRRHSCSLTQ